MKSILFYTFISLLAILSLVSIAEQRFNDGSNGKKPEKTAIVASSSNKVIVLNIEIADTPKERELGLSGKNTLSPQDGLLFIFEKPGIYPFWMKDMKFPIDIIWMTENKEIVEISPNVATTTYPNTLSTKKPIKYVLEVNANFANVNSLKVGDILEIKDK